MIDYDFCDCCTPMENTFALMKAKKKSKPFHGYNPNRHHRKGGLNAKDVPKQSVKLAQTSNHL